MLKVLSTSFLLICLLLSVGCQSAQPRQLEVVQCPPVEPAPAWMMVPENEETYTQRMLQLLSN